MTYAQAAAILGVHVSNVPKLVTRGEIRSRGTRGPHASLLRADVEAVLERRRERRRAKAGQEAAPPPRPVTAPPDDDHEWLTLEEAGEVIGISGQAVGKRAKRGKIPHVRQGVRVWVRADHAQIAANSRTARQILRPA
ncbi:DNA binding domain-containing protein, excisionase family [Nocardioides scoriae]|uniref:DNA binding domain-containing protein, excisionase family n=1 Tax=Nocardioides scoriae TaxID=642780 RepID=A0A1H1QBH2_9ACTN|nr:hypothetical protein [Nocardioides scoriae]SDS20770.1 DNA binding domain-containing protein, excisionase family [Nocardioides scoriae]